VVGGGAGGGGVSFFAQAETPSDAAAKATKVKYFTMFISLASFLSLQHIRIRLNPTWIQMDFQKFVRTAASSFGNTKNPRTAKRFRSLSNNFNRCIHINQVK
jgi:hypothetical protein